MEHLDHFKDAKEQYQKYFGADSENVETVSIWDKKWADGPVPTPVGDSNAAIGVLFLGLGALVFYGLCRILGQD